MPDGESTIDATDANPGVSKTDLEAPQPLSAIERRELRRQARTPMTEEQLMLWMERENEYQAQHGLAGEGYEPV